MKSQKGFVVSLKMVLIIILIAILIAIPIVMTIVENSRKSAMLDIARRVNDSAYRYFVRQLIHEQDILLDLEKDMDKLEMAGSKPKGGIIKIETTGNVSFAIYNEYWCVIKRGNEAEYELSEYEVGNCSLSVS